MYLTSKEKPIAKKTLTACSKCLLFVITTLVFLTFNSSTAHAADGDLDTSMTGSQWQNGTRINPTSNRVDGAYDVMAKADGTWTVSGYWSNNTASNTAHSWFQRQYDSVGGGTSTFQGNPKDRLFWSPKGDHIKKTLEMVDGRYAMVGYAGTDTGLGSGLDFDCVIAVRKADGTLDETGFNSSGYKPATVIMGNTKGRFHVAFSNTNDDYCYDGDIAPDGRIVVCGFMDTASNGKNIAIARVATTGELDTTFSSDGKQMQNLSGGDDVCRAVKVQADYKILVMHS